MLIYSNRARQMDIRVVTFIKKHRWSMNGLWLYLIKIFLLLIWMRFKRFIKIWDKYALKEGIMQRAKIITKFILFNWKSIWVRATSMRVLSVKKWVKHKWKYIICSEKWRKNKNITKRRFNTSKNHFKSKQN